MKADAAEWLFLSSDIRADGTVLFRLWKFFAAAPHTPASFLAMPRTSENVRTARNLGKDARNRIIWLNLKAAHRLPRDADAIFATPTACDELSRLSRRMPLFAPIVIVPTADEDPPWRLRADSADNCIFRYAAQSESVLKYLAIAKGFRPYQLLLSPDLQSPDEGLFAAEARRLAGGVLFAHDHSIAFAGFALTHVGGTPVATHALAEGLLEMGWQVKYVSVLLSVRTGTPPGVQTVGMSDVLHGHPAKGGMFSRLLPRRIKQCYLRYDHGRFPDVCGVMLRRFLKSIRARVLASTRESIHLFVGEMRNSFVKSKVFFFHCQSEALCRNFGDAVSAIRRMRIGKAVFVTESNRRALAQRYALCNFGAQCVLGNGLSSSRMVERNEVHPLPVVNGDINICWPVRISEGRASDFENLFAFALYLKRNSIGGIHVSVYGQGEYLDRFLEKKDALGLGGIIDYKGLAGDMRSVYAKHHVVVDFTRAQSFGMVYIEAVLNGRLVFCYRNEGSSEVLRDIPDAFFETPEELVAKLKTVLEVTEDVLLRNYDLIAARFSRTAIAGKFVEFVDKDPRQCL